MLWTLVTEGRDRTLTIQPVSSSDPHLCRFDPWLDSAAVASLPKQASSASSNAFSSYSASGCVLVSVDLGAERFHYRSTT